jgi:hypothetical protein
MRKSLLAIAVLAALPAFGAEVGLIKVSQGVASIERAGKRVPATVGMALEPSDIIVTARDGAVGVTFTDNSVVSVGPDSVFAIDRYAFDTTTYAGQFDGTLSKGRLAAVSGKMVKQSPESMKIHTPSAVMGVRGTEFVVQVDEPASGAR